MGFWKITPFLALSILALFQVGVLQAATISTDVPNPHYTDFSPKEKSLFQVGGVRKAYALKKMTTRLSQEKEAARLEKRCNNLSTCVLGTYTQELNRYHTFPQTAVGVGAPGKKRSMSNSLETNHDSHTARFQNTY